MEVLQDKAIEIEENVNATKETISGGAIWDLVKDADLVVVASGKKILQFQPRAEKNEMLAKISGRTGNLRAPTTRVGHTYYVGFNEQLYREYIS